MVLPPALVATFSAAKRVTDRHAASGVQRALALLLDDGSYDRHLRRMRRLQQARQRALLDALTRRLGGRAVVQGAASGLHLVVWLPELPASQEAALVQAARERGVRVYPIEPLFCPRTGSRRARRSAGLIMGYSLLDLDVIDEGVRRLELAVSSFNAPGC